MHCIHIIFTIDGRWRIASIFQTVNDCTIVHWLGNHGQVVWDGRGVHRIGENVSIVVDGELPQNLQKLTNHNTHKRMTLRALVLGICLQYLLVHLHHPTGDILLGSNCIVPFATFAFPLYSGIIRTLRIPGVTGIFKTLFVIGSRTLRANECFVAIVLVAYGTLVKVSLHGHFKLLLIFLFFDLQSNRIGIFYGEGTVGSKHIVEIVRSRWVQVLGTIHLLGKF
mmetsp:Transcript_1795/g.3387  ORF Transcript_1795/g.3387 Transcript_1795/m.3387 type:complete len:224 (+) Transcript_1795:1457-2128(+)